MKKSIIIFFSLFLIACSNGGENITCNINGKEAIFTLKDGIIKNYKLDNQNIRKSEIDEINGTYFTSAVNNEEGKQVLQSYVNSLGGTCE